MSAPAVVVTELRKRWKVGWRRTHEALRGVSLSIPVGSAFGLIGVNGAGKTTLIKTLLGITRSDAGEVRVWGESPGALRVRARIGYLPERLELPRAWSPREYLDSVRRLRGLPSPWRADPLLERVGMGALADRKLGSFSKGQKQRVGLAAALVGSPDLLVLDEPTDGIDPVGRIEIRNLLKEERARGATILLNSHLLAETERICDHIAVLGEGQIRAHGPLQELEAPTNDYEVELAPSGVLPDASALQRLHLQPQERPHHYLLRADSAELLNQRLEGLRGAGCLLLGLRRQKGDLERLLSQVTAMPGAGS